MTVADLPLEIWRPVVGYETEYMVSNRGRVKSMSRVVLRPRKGLPAVETRLKEKLLKAGLGGHGYFTVALSRDGQSKTFPVHLLVLTAHEGERPNGMVARHLNGERRDCNLSNLVWGTPAENHEDARRHGTAALADGHGMAKLTRSQVLEVRHLRGTERQVDIAARMGVSVQTVKTIQRGASWATLTNDGTLDVSIHSPKQRRNQETTTP